MRVIYKYPLPEQLGGTTTITGKINALLSIQNQPGTGNCLWCEIDDNADEVKMTIIALGTGIEYIDNENVLYIGTAIDANGYVWHYYAKLEKTQLLEWGDYISKPRIIPKID